jgi:hypothetical protein
MQGQAMARGQEATGRGAYLIVEAPTFAVEALSRLPIELRPDSNIDDMKPDRPVREARRNARPSAADCPRRFTMHLEHVGRQGKP